MSDEPTERDVEALRREARKHGTDSPHEPTVEFVRHAFAEGARYLWPDSRDPGWFVTFDRWFAERIAQARREGAAEALGKAAEALNTEGVGFSPGGWGSNDRDRDRLWGISKSRDWLRARAAALRGDDA